MSQVISLQRLQRPLNSSDAVNKFKHTPEYITDIYSAFQTFGTCI
ncbi:hypothetical protein NPM18_13340 [Bacillus cereus]|uniref:Uncharacterized protein n=1 Tax=Bacillus cereus TaxID=1396 RepID=A0AAW5L1T8_BACCE|nr:hypothetical protein [Bacillus cereus]MCQ6304892.1 hypothetical protein [Bacillus cereus]MCQ6317274.1 hypothetical protein [Bacillus cereus]MCQ6328004.1 hypothetical protein [Bacillus cereus]MCQ6385361.1 hypothetical protein [Bacillus cereus]